MKKAILIMNLIFIGSASMLFAQQKQLSRQEFYTAIRKANDERFKNSRREKMTLKIFSRGVLEGTTTEIEEFLMPDKKRYISIEEISGKSERLELIKINNAFYQRKNSGKWTKEKRWNVPVSFLSIPVPTTSEYTVEDTTINNKPAKIYRFFAIYDETQPEDGEEKQTFWEQKTWINNQGLEIKEEIIMGKPKTKQILSHRIFEYEHHPKDLKIEAPIK